MRSNPNRKPRINVVTLGCSKNLVDSEELLTQLQGNGIRAVHEGASKTDIVVVNTCGFIDRAKQESIDTILAYANEKQAGNIRKLVVTGCLSERYKDDLSLEIPEVDAWFGTQDLPTLLKELGADYKQELVGERIPVTDGHYAYLKIAEGCDRPCSFCAIPLMRGNHRSRTIDSLVSEATHLAERGVKELMLIAQDLTYYGLDLNGKRQLRDLLLHLRDVPGLEWIRLHYAYPSGFPTDILPVIAESPNICNYLDMPLQHIADDILKSMRRGTTRQKTYDLIAQIRKAVPGISLRTTLITGYPGETDQHHQEVLAFIRDVRFDRLGVFTYSHEEQTHAFALNDDVPEEVKEERKAEIMEVQQDISFDLNRAQIGKIRKVLIDRTEGDLSIGRTEADSPEVDNEVMVRATLVPGQFYHVQIKDAMEFDLIGELA